MGGPENLKDNRGVAAVVLGAGRGKRMKSDIPKVLHRACGRPLIAYVLEEVCALRPGKVVVVVGHGAEAVRSKVDFEVDFVRQDEQLGTGHAVMVAMEELDEQFEEILVLPGDSPLIRSETLQSILDARRMAGAAAAFLSVEMEDPAGYGRVVRGGGGEVLRIVEEADADEAETEIREVNACTYAFSGELLGDYLELVTTDNAQGEYYLTHLVERLVSDGAGVVAVAGNAEEALGVNNREQLSAVSSVLRARKNRSLMLDGVTMVDPQSVFIDNDVRVGRDTVIMPFVFVGGSSRIGEGCRIGPGCSINDSVVGDRCTVEFSFVDGSVLSDEVLIGPFSRLRPGCRIGERSKVGSFVEMKNTVVGEESKIPHLSYMGDATIGDAVNVGAGSITCNYDGEEKHPTEIGDRAFLGSDTMLIAPVRIGEDAATGAGSSITEDVPDGSLGIERSQQKNVPLWRDKKRKKGRHGPPSSGD